MMLTAQTRYAKSGDVHIAYQVVGEGPPDLVVVNGWVISLELYWDDPGWSSFFRRLASFSRLIMFDKRGTGLSDRVSVREMPTLEERMDDVRAVMDAVGSNEAFVFGISEGGPMSMLFAATYPERTSGLALYGSFPCHFQQLHGKELSYNNILDLTAAASLRISFLRDVARSTFPLVLRVYPEPELVLEMLYDPHRLRRDAVAMRLALLAGVLEVLAASPQETVAALAAGLDRRSSAVHQQQASDRRAAAGARLRRFPLAGAAPAGKPGEDQALG